MVKLWPRWGTLLMLVLCCGLVIGTVVDQAEAEDPQVENITDISSPDDVDAVKKWKDRCRETVGEEALLEIEKAKEEFVPCVSKIIKWDKLQKEINRSIPRGELDLVFKKYCGRRDRLVACIEDVFTSVDKCLNEQEQADFNITRKAIDAGIDFVCHNDGDRIALFMAEEGEQCIKSQKDDIQACVEEQVPEMNAAEDLLKLTTGEVTINEENCQKLNAMHRCVVKYTEKCEDPTPANILDSLITQMLKATPCWEMVSTTATVVKESSGAMTLTFQPQLLLSNALTVVAAALTAANILL